MISADAQIYIDTDVENARGLREPHLQWRCSKMMFKLLIRQVP